MAVLTSELASFRTLLCISNMLWCMLCSPVKKMFRFMTGDKHSPTAGSSLESPYSLSPVGQDSPMGIVSPKLAARKIARSPFKVRAV